VKGLISGKVGWEKEKKERGKTKRKKKREELSGLTSMDGGTMG
jgi:hypothetical protein